MKLVNKFLAAFLFFVGLAVPVARAGSVIRYEYDKYGNCKSVATVANDGTTLEKTTYEYDQYRRPTSMIEAAQTTSQARTWTWIYDRYFGTQGYDPSAHTSKQWRVQMEPAYDANSNRNVTARWFDANDRIVDEYTGVIQGPGGMYNGPDIEVHHFSYDENGQKKTYTDPRNRLTTYVYDNRNRLWQTIEPLSRITETLYDFAGNKTDVTFPDTRSQRWRDFDAFGQSWTYFDERNNRTDLAYQWGPMKKLASVTTHRSKDGGGTEDQPTIFGYDGLGRSRIVTFPDHTTEENVYLHGGQLLSWKTRKGQTKTINYDARGRETSSTWLNGAAPDISRSWDDANRVATLCNIYSTVDFHYDGAGLVAAEGNAIAGGGGRIVTNYERYPNGAISRIIYPTSSLSVRRDYNSRGQLSATGWSDSNNNWLAQFASYNYLADGKLNYQDYINGVHTAFGYDDRGFVNQETVSAGGHTYSQRTFYRDSRDRITAFQKGTNPTVNPMENGHGDRFRYDEEGQLVEAWYNATDPANSGTGNTRYDGFNYDALGNRTQSNFVASRGSTSFVRRDNGLNQYSSWTPSTIYHDDNYPGWGPSGNGVTMMDGWIDGSYNALNQPISMSSATSGGTTWFGYDPLGRCVKRVVGSNVNNGTATFFYYDGWNLFQEGPAANIIDRVYMLGNRVDDIVADYSTATGQWLYHHSDARGHSILLTDGSGNLVEQYEYDAFGQPYFYGAGGALLANGSAYGNRFLFTGREYLSALKLYDYRNRLYQPELGRFMQPDPKEFGAGDYNLYRYCHNDPINKSDPFGLKDAYEYPDASEAAAARALIDRLAAMKGPIADAIKAMRDNPKTITFIPVQHDRAGLDHYSLQPHNKGQENINRTTARNDENSRNGKGTGSYTELNPRNWDSLSGKRDPVIGAGHEVDHGLANLQGRHLPGALEEKRAQEFEKLIRKEVEKGK